MRQYLWWLLPMSWAGVIFMFSSQPATEQEMEPFLTEYLPLHGLEPVLKNIEFMYYGSERSIDAMGLSGFVEFLIRKLAHFGVYFILAVLIYLAVRKTVHIKTRFQILISYFLTINFAILDELNQSFTPGRTPYYGDILIDSFGALVGLLCVYIAYNFFRSRTDLS